MSNNSLTIVRSIRTKTGRSVSVVEMGRRRGTSMALKVRATKFEAAYTDLAKNIKEQCVFCIHFVSGEVRGEVGECDRVIGPIMPTGWCKFFERRFKGVIAT
jgi:hypothetical protein